jgi:DNA-binding transcriptional ArsR family regulator
LTSSISRGVLGVAGPWGPLASGRSDSVAGQWDHFTFQESLDMDVSSALNASRQFDAISDPHRLRILDVLASGEFHVGALQERLGLRQQATSHHIKILLLRGFIPGHRVGKRMFYGLTDEGRRLLLGARAMVA